VFKQSLEIIRLNILILPERLGSSLISVIGIACVVAVFVGLFSIATSFQTIILSNGDEDTLLVMSEDADFEGNSSLDRLTMNAIADSPLLAQGEDGAMASFEFTRPISITRKEGGDLVNINVRGVTPAAYQLRSGFEIVEGRPVEEGRFELIAGRAAQQQFAGLNIGDMVTIAASQWEVVGIFENNAGATESELWGDLLNLQSVFRIGNTTQSARVNLNDPTQVEAFTAQLNDVPQVSVSVRNEAQYIEESSQGFLQIVNLLSIPLVVIMAMGAIFAALNTMYSSVSSRTREIATLRAIGFGSFPIAMSVLVEALLLALAGAVLGVLVIYLGLSGYTTNTNFLSNTQFAFSFVITPQLMLQGIFCALVIGLLGGLFPAVRAGRMSIVTALREL
jgi:putative ABC transport system permease protein